MRAMKAVLLPNQVFEFASAKPVVTTIFAAQRRLSRFRLPDPEIPGFPVGNAFLKLGPGIRNWENRLASIVSQQTPVPRYWNLVMKPVILGAPKVRQPWYYRLQTQGAAS